LRLHLSVPDTLSILGDRDMLQQAISNLLDNAIKFSPRGGTIRLEAAPSDRHARISVADEGPGIPEPDRGRATERFFRGEQARNTPGYGLGLALVQAVAALHEGTLVLADAKPGLLATITLPAMKQGALGGHMNIPSSAPHWAESGTMADVNQR
jgi:signal transduction histidine kinase